MKLITIPWKLVLILAIFEIVTLFFAAIGEINTSEFSPVTNMAAGFLIGVVSTGFIIHFLNIFLGRRKVCYKKDRVKSVSYFSPMIWNGIFLGLLFLFESLFYFLKNTWWGTLLTGLIVLPITLTLVIALYHLVPYPIVFFTKYATQIDSISFIGVLFFATIYECLFLIGFFYWTGFAPNVFLYPVAGGVLGVIAGLIAKLLYDYLCLWPIEIGVHKEK